MKKQAVQQLLDTFPEEVNTEDLIWKLHLKAKLDEAERALADGDTLTREQVIEETDKWFR